MRTVYAVSQGVYSDYRVLALFEAENDAEAHAADISRSDRWSETFVEGFEIFPTGELPVAQVTYHASADGLDEQPHIYHSTTVFIYDAEFNKYRRPEVRVRENARGTKIIAHALDAGVALKCVREKQAELKAQSEGL